jgi:GntR family transcriptional regulator
MSFSELGAARGLRASAEVLLAQVRPADLDEAERFAIAPGSGIFELERSRFLDELPVSIDHSRVPLSRANTLPQVDFTHASLYETLETYGVRPVRADFTVCAIAADSRRAGHLGIEPGSPLLQTTTTGYDDQGRVVELGEMAYRGDRYRFRATLTRRA